MTDTNTDTQSNVIQFPTTPEEASLAIAAGTLCWADEEAAAEWLAEATRRKDAGESLEGLDLPEMVTVG